MFFDTNVLLYMHGGDPAKRQRAQELYREYAPGGRLVLSTQVVQEFYAAGSRRFAMPRVPSCGRLPTLSLTGHLS